MVPTWRSTPRTCLHLQRSNLSSMSKERSFGPTTNLKQTSNLKRLPGHRRICMCKMRLKSLQNPCSLFGKRQQNPSFLMCILTMFLLKWSSILGRPCRSSAVTLIIRSRRSHQSLPWKSRASTWRSNHPNPGKNFSSNLSTYV